MCLSIPVILVRLRSHSHLVKSPSKIRFNNFILAKGSVWDFLVKLKGRLPKVKKWGQTARATISFGHGLMVTSAQMVAAVGAIANGGMWHQPKIIGHVTNPFGEEVLEPNQPSGERVFSAETAKVMTQIMTSVVEEGGTAPKAAIPRRSSSW